MPVHSKVIVKCDVCRAERMFDRQGLGIAVDNWVVWQPGVTAADQGLRYLSPLPECDLAFCSWPCLSSWAKATIHPQTDTGGDTWLVAPEAWGGQSVKVGEL